MNTREWLMLVMAGLVAACGGGSGNSSTEEPGIGYRAGPGPQGGSALYSQFRGGRKQVLHQHPTTAVAPADLRDGLATMESTLAGDDGVFLRLPTTGDLITRGKAVNAAAIAKDLEPLYALKPNRLKYNFALVPMQRDLDAFDDWSAVIANFTALAKVTRDAGLVGIVIDSEAWRLRADPPHERKFAIRTLADYQAQTQLVGKKIMQAIVTGFPDAVVVVLRGPAGADTGSSVSRVENESGTAQLLGAFFAGFVEATVPGALLVDGGSDDGPRIAERWKAAEAGRRSGPSSVATPVDFAGDRLVSTVE